MCQCRMSTQALGGKKNILGRGNRGAFCYDLREFYLQFYRKVALLNVMNMKYVGKISYVNAKPRA